MLNGATRAHVVLSVGKHHRHLAEIVVNWQRLCLTRQSDTTDMYVSASQAVDRLRRQALKVKRKIITSKHRSLSTSAVAPSPLPPVEPERRPAHHPFAALFGKADDRRRGDDANERGGRKLPGLPERGD